MSGIAHPFMEALHWPPLRIAIILPGGRPQSPRLILAALFCPSRARSVWAVSIPTANSDPFAGWAASIPADDKPEAEGEAEYEDADADEQESE